MMLNTVQTAFIGGGIGNTIAASQMVAKLIELIQKGNAPPLPQKLLIIDRNAYFGGGVPWGKDTHPTSFFNNPTRLTEPEAEFKAWVLNNLDALANYLHSQGGKVSQRWLEENYRQLKNGDFEEVYFPRRFYGFFLEDKLYQTLQKAWELGIEINLLEASVERLKINYDGSKTILLRGNHGYKIAMTPVTTINAYPQFQFHRQEEFLGFLETNNVCIGIGAFPPPEFPQIQDHPNYIANLYEGAGIENLSKKILATYQQKKNSQKVRLVFLGSSAGLLEPLLEIEANPQLRNNVEILSISHQGKTKNRATLSGKIPLYQPQFLVNKIVSCQELITALEKEYVQGKKEGYSSYDIWCSCHSAFAEVIKKLNQNYPKEYLEYLKTGFSQIRKLTSFTNPDTVAAKELLEREGILTLKQGEITKIEEGKQELLLEIYDTGENLDKIKADIIVNTLGSDNIENLLRKYPLIQSLLECGAEINESGNGFKTDENQQAGDGLFIIGALAFGGNRQNLNYALRYTHLKAVFEEAITTGNALALKANQERLEKGIPSWQQCLKVAQERNHKIPETVTNDNRLICHTNHFYAIVGWGAFIPGYLLVMAKDNQYLSFGALPKEHYSEARWLIHGLSTIVSDTYNRIINQFYETQEIAYIENIVFEHGAVLGKPGCACDKPGHVHIMIKPVKKYRQEACKWYHFNNQKSSSLPPNKDWQTEAEIISQVITSRIVEANLIDIELGMQDLHELQDKEANQNNLDSFPDCTEALIKQKHPYVYFYSQDKKNSFLISAHFKDEFRPKKLSKYLEKMGIEDSILEIFLGSQLGRQIIARLWGIEGELWNWQENPYYENMQNTMIDLSLNLPKLLEQSAAITFSYAPCII